jgi:hypothetical protein
VFLQTGAVERAGQQFADDGFVALGSSPGMNSPRSPCGSNRPPTVPRWRTCTIGRPARRAAASTCLMLATAASMPLRASGPLRYSFWASMITSRMAEVGCCVTTAAELKHRLWNGHSGAP